MITPCPGLCIDPLGLTRCIGQWALFSSSIVGDPRSTGPSPTSSGGRGGLPRANRIPNARGPNPAGPAGERPFQIIAPGLCFCRWNCVPCGEGDVIFDPRRLPITRGLSINTGLDITSGDTCLCSRPGPETGRTREDLCGAPPKYYTPPVYDFGPPLQ
jgi:hypothetical protein